jgi:AraC family transcriptional regulator
LLTIINYKEMSQNSRQKYLREEYKARVNRVIDHIEANIDQELPLAALAEIAGFSPFHFHRIFSSLIGETLNGFIQRIRLEKAASILMQNPKESITNIALECGFSGSSAFARAFREAFGMNASEWRAGGYSKDRNTCQSNSKEWQVSSNIRQDFDPLSDYSKNKQEWRVEMKTNQNLITNIEVKNTPEISVAYIRHIGPYAGDVELFGRLFNKLAAWAGPRGLLASSETRFLTIYHDSPELTDPKKLRTDVCITVPADTRVDGEIGKATIPAGKNAIAHFEIKSDQYTDAWNAIYGGWLPESGYQPDDRPCFELYLNDAKDHPEGKCIVDIYVPVKPL